MNRRKKKKGRIKILIVCCFVSLVFALIPTVGLILLGAPTWAWVPALIIIWSWLENRILDEFKTDTTYRRYF